MQQLLTFFHRPDQVSLAHWKPLFQCVWNQEPTAAGRLPAQEEWALNDE